MTASVTLVIRSRPTLTPYISSRCASISRIESPRLYSARMFSSYAESRVMPSLGRDRLWLLGFGGLIPRHNQSASRNASSRSGGRYLPGVVSGGVVLARARSLIVMSACK